MKEQATATPELEVIDNTATAEESSQPSPIEPILEDGLWIDPETGEIIGESEPQTSTVFGVDEANGVLARLRWHSAKAMSAKARLSTVQERIQSHIDQALEELETDPEMIDLRAREAFEASKFVKASKAVEWLTLTYKAAIGQLAKQLIGTKKERNYKFDEGTVLLKKVAATVAIDKENEALALATAEKNGWLEMVKKSLLISKLPKEKKEEIVSFEDASAYPGFQFVAEYETVTIDTGIKL